MKYLKFLLLPLLLLTLCGFRSYVAPETIDQELDQKIESQRAPRRRVANVKKPSTQDETDLSVDEKENLEDEARPTHHLRKWDYEKR